MAVVRHERVETVLVSREGVVSETAPRKVRDNIEMLLVDRLKALTPSLTLRTKPRLVVVSELKNVPTNNKAVEQRKVLLTVSHSDVPEIEKRVLRSEYGVETLDNLGVHVRNVPEGAVTILDNVGMTEMHVTGKIETHRWSLSVLSLFVMAVV
jgi:hypothetical protein